MSEDIDHVGRFLYGSTAIATSRGTRTSDGRDGGWVSHGGGGGGSDTAVMI